jgi:hypothetical protein
MCAVFLKYLVACISTCRQWRQNRTLIEIKYTCLCRGSRLVLEFKRLYRNPWNRARNKIVQPVSLLFFNFWYYIRKYTSTRRVLCARENYPPFFFSISVSGQQSPINRWWFTASKVWTTRIVPESQAHQIQPRPYSRMLQWSNFNSSSHIFIQWQLILAIYMKPEDHWVVPYHLPMLLSQDAHIACSICCNKNLLAIRPNILPKLILLFNVSEGDATNNTYSQLGIMEVMLTFVKQYSSWHLPSNNLLEEHPRKLTIYRDSSLKLFSSIFGRRVYKSKAARMKLLIC